VMCCADALTKHAIQAQTIAVRIKREFSRGSENML
jgi:hypothetical protein